jgi:hypothetical protein
VAALDSAGWPFSAESAQNSRLAFIMDNISFNINFRISETVANYLTQKIIPDINCDYIIVAH